MEPPNGLDLLLDWLDKDRDKAGEIYIKLLERLEFTFDQFEDPELFANEVIDRVCKNLQNNKVDKTGNALNYIGGVTKYLKREKWRNKKVFLPFNPEIEVKLPEPDKIDEEKYEKLYSAAKDCIEAAGEDGKLLMEYYSRTESTEKFDYRKILADENDIKMGTLRVKVLRIRAKLKKCVEKKIN